MSDTATSNNGPVANAQPGDSATEVHGKQASDTTPTASQKTSSVQQTENRADSRQEDDPVLLYAWRRLTEYSDVSTHQKKTYRRLRGWVVAIALLASAGAVIVTYLNDFSIELIRSGIIALAFFSLVVYWPFRFLFFNEIPQLGRIIRSIAAVGLIALIALTSTSMENGLSDLMRIMLFVLPIASVAILNYADQFATSNTWIEYRASAEHIRSNIYLYRMDAGEYEGKSIEDKRSYLREQIKIAEEKITLERAVPFLNTLKNRQTGANSESPKDLEAKEIKERIQTDDIDHDNGLNNLEIDDYINWRVRQQIEWYISKIQTDYRTLRYWRVFALIIAALGSVLAGLGGGLEALVAVTTAVGVAISLTSQLRMYGATYSIYHWAATELMDLVAEWEARPDDQKTEKAQNEFVTNIEKIFHKESQRWRKQAIQIQAMSEQQFFEQMKQGRFELQSMSVPNNSVDEIPSEDTNDDKITTDEQSADSNVKVKG